MDTFSFVGLRVITLVKGQSGGDSRHEKKQEKLALFHSVTLQPTFRKVHGGLQHGFDDGMKPRL